MTDDELRARIRERMGRGELPRQFPDGVRLPTDSLVESSLEIGPQRGRRCFICTGPEPDVTHRYSNGETISVHRVPCEALWREEQARLARRAARALHEEK